ncbi:MAG: CARDB domain-containing protein [Candidatus Pacearchaeota archaeon]
MNLKYSLVVVVLVAVLGVFVFAQTPLNSPPPLIVNAISCSETDGGLNYYAQGTVTGSFWWPGTNGTNLTYVGGLTDACASSTVLLEGACGSSINTSLSNLAGALYVNCAAPNPAFGCVNGACVFVGTNGTNNSGGSGGGNSSGNGTSSLPNLVIFNITSVSYNATIITNWTSGTNSTTYTVNVTALVRNIGAVNAGSSFTAIFYPSLASSTQIATPSIPSGQTRLVSRIYFNVAPGSYFGIAHADNTTIVTETIEFDNLLYSTIVVP